MKSKLQHNLPTLAFGLAPVDPTRNVLGYSAATETARAKVQEAADAVRTKRAEEKRLCDPRLYRDDVRRHR